MKKQRIAFFDFDGTITWLDTFQLFLIWHAGPISYLWQFLKCTGTLFRAFRGKERRSAHKLLMLRKVLNGVAENDYRISATAFGRMIVPLLIRPKAHRRIAWHKAQGDRLVILSASFSEWITPWAHSKGFEKVCASNPEVKEGKMTGFLSGEECNYELKKQLMLSMCTPRRDFTIYAYGNSQGDSCMLAEADHKYMKCLG